LQGSVHINLFCDCAGDPVPSAPERERLALDALVALDALDALDGLDAVDALDR